MNLRNIDLSKLNSLTKYPSIPTFHMLGDKGRLLDEHLPIPAGPLFATEKIDGTNCRIVLTSPEDASPAFLIGSRENWLHAQGDLIWDSAQQIVEAVQQMAKGVYASERMQSTLGRVGLYVLYGEVYGGKVTAASRCYSSTQKLGFRLFDAALFGADFVAAAIANWQPSQIASWRERGGQQFLSVDAVEHLAAHLGVSIVPRVTVLSSPAPAGTTAETHDWLCRHAPIESQAALDVNMKPGRSEGLVIRSADRAFIAKLRFEDYERTLRSAKKAA